MAGDYLHWQMQFARRNTDVNILAATDDSTLIAVRSANHQLYIQRIVVSVTTYSAKTWLIKDNASTPVPIAFFSIPAAAAALPSESGTIVFDFGPNGAALTLGKDLTLDVSAAGAAGFIHIDAYEKLGTTVAVASTN
jgi:hypothetical protein